MRAVKDMKSVMIFDPNEPQEKTEQRWVKWWNHNKVSAVGDKFVPGVEQTRQYLTAGEQS